MCVHNAPSGLLQIGHELEKNDNDARICWHNAIVKFFVDVLFLLSNLVTGPSFMSISSLVMDLEQFYFIRDWPEIWKLEIP